MSPPSVVEFAGVPGSGKTSLSTRAAESLRASGMASFTALDAARLRAAQSVSSGRPTMKTRGRVERATLWWLFYLASSLKAVPFAWQTRSEISRLARRQIRPRMKAHITWWFLQLGGRRRYLDSSKWIDAVMYDDGFVHRSVALFSSPGEPPDLAGIDDYLTSIPLPDVVVHVRAGVDTCVRRVIDRGLWEHSKTASTEDLRSYLETADGILQTAIDVMRTRGVLVLEVGNDEGSLEETAASLSKLLEPILVSEPSPGYRQ